MLIVPVSFDLLDKDLKKDITDEEVLAQLDKELSKVIAFGPKRGRLRGMYETIRFNMEYLMYCAECVYASEEQVSKWRKEAMKE